MTTTALDASVIICAYSMDRWDDLCAAVSSVRSQTSGPAEVILVIDHNTALLERALVQFDEVRVLASTGEPGLSGARNTGVAEATGSIVAFLDDDAVAAPGWMAALVRPITDGVAEVTGGRADAVFDDGRPEWFPAEFDWVVGCTYLGHPTDAGPIRNPIGCNMAFRATALAEAGPFRSDMGRSGARPLGCEETELCIRLVKRRPETRIRYVPDATVTQRVPHGRATLRYFVSRCRAEGLSKAQVATSVGTDRALSSERGYVSRVLPAGVARALLAAIRAREISSAARAVAIVAGLVATVAGYAEGRLSRWRSAPAPTN